MGWKSTGNGLFCIAFSHISAFSQKQQFVNHRREKKKMKNDEDRAAQACNAAHDNRKSPKARPHETVVTNEKKKKKRTIKKEEPCFLFLFSFSFFTHECMSSALKALRCSTPRQRKKEELKENSPPQSPKSNNRASWQTARAAPYTHVCPHAWFASTPPRSATETV